ncbi:MAG TPA: HlyD family efflux transporter periplasmic adaptor subunit [Coleofasciculaceae cyanobacterium]|jgi:multidrug efflux pump subunit AcrA (membrane-fusion protein)
MLTNPPPGFLPQLQENEFLPPIGRWIIFGGVFVVTTVGLTVPLSSVAKYKETVKAPASLRPAGELRIVQAATPGTITELRVRENQPVKQGDIIAIVDGSRLETKQTQLEDNIRQSKLQLQQIQAQIAAQNNRILAEQDRLNRAVTSANAELDRRQREYQNLMITTAAEVEEAEANLELAAEELNQAQTDLITATADWNSSKAELSAAVAKRNRYQTIADSGALSRDHLEEAKLSVVQLQQQVYGKQAAIKRQQQEITRRELAVAAVQARNNSVRAALNPSDAEVAIARSNIAQERAVGRATIANLHKEQQALEQQRIELQNQIERDKSELQQVKRELEQSIITATADGTIFQLNLRNTGQTVVAGDKIAQIAPEDATLTLKAMVSAKEIGKIKTNQTTSTKISACPYPDYGTLKGTVTKIAPDAIAPQTDNARGATQANIPSGKAFYEVAIAPETNVLQRQQHQCLLQSGMEGTTDIITREETVLKFLLRKAKLLTNI